MEKRSQTCDEPDLFDSNDTLAPDFIEGLSRLLCGISANFSTNVVATPMGYFIVRNYSRFKHSRTFGNLLLSQLKDYIDYTQKVTSFQIRTSNDKASDKR